MRNFDAERKKYLGDVKKRNGQKVQFSKTEESPYRLAKKKRLESEAIFRS